jgi:hypothetical protein
LDSLNDKIDELQHKNSKKQKTENVSTSICLFDDL